MRVPAAVATVLRGACLVVLLVTGPAAGARASASGTTPTVSELTGGVTPGFSAGAGRGSRTTLTPAGAAVAPAAVSAAISGLQPDTLYHYRLAATNDTDTSVVDDRTLTTNPGPTGGTVSDTQAPSAPGSLRGRYIRASLLLDWRPASDNAGVARYQLYRDGAPRSTVAGGSSRLVLPGFRTRRRTVLVLRAFDAAGNAGPDSNGLIVTSVPRPRGIPRTIPRWARRLLSWQQRGKHGTRPATPARLPAWYMHGKRWQLAPYRIVSAAVGGGRARPAVLPQQAGTVDLASQANFTITGGGATVAAAGDVNGDGLADVIVEAPGRGAYVVFGRSSPGTVDLGSLVNGGFRIASVDGPIAAAGDVNGDGFGDLLVGAGGAIYVVFGRPSVRAVDLAALGDGGFRIGGAGVSVAAGAGDVNGDGRADLIVGSGNAACVVFGKSSSTPVDLTALGDGFRIGAGAGVSAVAGAGDVNGDGRADVIVRAAPAVYVVFGQASTAPVDLAALGPGGFRIGGAAQTDLFSVAGAGDVNGDGRADVIVGDGAVARGGVPGAGSAFVVFGKPSPGAVDVAALGNGGFRIDGAGEDAGAGASVAGAGDVNGDGLADVIVGAPGANGIGRRFSGAAYVVFGKSSPATVDLGVLGSEGFAAEGAATLDSAGTSVAGPGDVNGDGRPDVIVGALAPLSTGNDLGLAYILYGFGAPELAYGQLTATVDAPIAPVGPTLSRQTGQPSFTVVPALPPGLTLDPATGTISGTPQATQASMVYAVTMSDLAGAVTASLAIQVDPAPAPPTPSTTTLLRVTLGGRHTQRLLRAGAIRLTAACNEPCALSAAGSVQIAGTRVAIALRPARARLAAAGATSLRLGLSPAARRRLRHLLRPGARGSATVTVRALDRAGNATSSTRMIAVLR